MTSPLKIETDDERDVLREIVARITHDYPIDADLDQIEVEIVRLTLCARLLRMAGAGSGPADAALVAALCDQERELVEAVGGDEFRLRKIDAPGADPEDWCWAGETLDGVRRELERLRQRRAQALEACRRLIARAEEG
ncbi:MAG: hypothetical protein QOK34_1592 [Gaiellaceae bacterium]|jgi:hypothetical protein|nr:hypothetical protein [Gaiellaceae bacterium]